MLEDASASESGADPLADDRIQFYLRHRAVIREWASIERDVAAATHQILVGLIPEIEVSLRELDPGAIVIGEAFDGSWPRIAGVRASWPRTASEEPVVEVTFEWTPKVDPSGGALPYYGVRVNADTDSGKAIRDHLRTLVAGSQAARAGFKAAGYPWWPIQQRMPATPEWWKHPEVFRADCVGRMVTAWQVLAPLVDAAVERAGPRAASTTL